MKFQPVFVSSERGHSRIYLMREVGVSSRALARRTAVKLLLGVVAAAVCGDRVTRGATNGFFDFHSGFWINLHHYLYLQAVLAAPDARKDGALAVQRAIPDRPMTAEQRAAWDKALGYYRQFGSRDALRDPVLIKANYELSDAGSDNSLAGRRIPADMRTALQDAAPVYRALWWPEQDRRNQAWITAATALVDRYGQATARRIASVYRMQWPAEIIPVEVVSYANWAGAYTTTHSTLITVSSLPESDQNAAALETVFHEASHALIHGVQEAIAKQCTADAVVLRPSTLWHAILFYTTGSIVKDLIPNYVPLADALGRWKRAWPMFIGPLEKDWQPYLDGKISFDAAVSALVRDASGASH